MAPKLPRLASVFAAAILSNTLWLDAQTVVFSNMSQGPYQLGAGWTIAGSGNGYASPQRVGLTFIPTSPTYLTSVDVLVFNCNSTTNGVVASLYGDQGGQPGSQLESAQKTNFDSGLNETARNIAFSGATLMSANTPYWLVISAIAADSWMAWDFINSTANYFKLTSALADPTAPGAWIYPGYDATYPSGPPMAQINGIVAAIPEPGSTALLSAVGVLILGVARSARPRGRI